LNTFKGNQIPPSQQRYGYNANKWHHDEDEENTPGRGIELKAMSLEKASGAPKVKESPLQNHYISSSYTGATGPGGRGSTPYHSAYSGTIGAQPAGGQELQGSKFIQGLGSKFT